MNWYVWSVPILAGVILLVSIVAKRMDWFLNYATRLCLGALALYLTSEAMTMLSMNCQVGVNPATVHTVSVLGIPGYALVVFVGVFSTLRI